MVLGDHHTILEANNGKSGLRLFEQHPEVDLIITDLSMAGMDGFDVIRAVRATGRPVKIIACSALIHQGNVEQMALAAGADACMAKPIDLGEFEIIVADLLRPTA